MKPNVAIDFLVPAMTFGLGDIIGESTAILAQVNKARRYAACDATVLITGETGTGKEVFARAIHYTSQRASRPFAPVNCAALPAELFENELFGHVGGAFTGAQRIHKGLIEEAAGGTLFLDEIDSLSMPAQAKLLRFLQEREYRPLGATRNRHVELRVIAGANIDLAKEVSAGRFRQDLYFRLNVLTLRLPPLREHREDIPLLANHLMHLHVAQGCAVKNFTCTAVRKLTNYSWPGNVRELENVIERALLLSTGPMITDADLEIPASEPLPPPQSFSAQKARLIQDFEQHYLQDALARNSGNITAAAKEAGKNRRAFFELLRKHHLTRYERLKVVARV